jgi:small subunit ribosomal protein S4
VSCRNNAVCKICRRENVKLFLKGDRCYTDKCSFDRRPYPPGQHGQARLKFSEFALQLREKQKLKRYFGMAEKPFKLTFFKADRSKGITGEELLKLLELRLDNVVYLMGAGSSRSDAKQLVRHRHILVNGKVLDIPSYILKKGDKIEVRDRAKAFVRVQIAQQGFSRRNPPSWLDVDNTKLVAEVKDRPIRDEVSVPVEENMIVEFYSR